MENEDIRQITNEGIPIVSQNIANVFGRDICTRGFEYNAELYNIIKKENSWIAEYLQSQDNQLKTTGYPNGQTMSAIIVYHLLRNQGEANRLRNQGDNE